MLTGGVAPIGVLPESVYRALAQCAETGERFLQAVS